MDIEDFKTTRFSVLGAGTKLVGELHFSGRTAISGEVEGHLVALPGAQLILEKTAHVRGSITGHDVEIHGTFDGTLRATGTLSLKPNCQVSGEVVAGHLVIYPGAQLNSECAAGN